MFVKGTLETYFAAKIFFLSLKRYSSSVDTPLRVVVTLNSLQT